MADTASIQVPADLAQVAEEKGIPLDLVRRGLALGFPSDAIKGQLAMPGVTAEAAEEFIAAQEALRGPGGEVTVPPELKEVADKHGWPESLVLRGAAFSAPPRTSSRSRSRPGSSLSRRSGSSSSRRPRARVAWRRRLTSRG